MKTVLLLLLAMLAIKTTTTTSASGQDVCSNSYISCLDKCVTRPSQTLQDSCMEACQTQNSACYSRQFGGPPPNAVTVKPQQMEQPANASADAHDADRPAEAPAAKPAKQKPTKTAKPAPRQERRAN